MKQSPEEIINMKMDAFLFVSKKASDNKEIEAKSKELTAYIKEPAFLQAAHRLLTTPDSFPHEKKDKEILLTSLVKDKFKYEFETIENNVEAHYQQLCQIAHNLQRTTYAAYTNIALALAYTYIHLLANHPYNLDAFLAPFLPSDPSKVKLYNYYFKTLEYIATQIDNNKFVIDEGQRQTAHERLVSQQLQVLMSLNNIAGGAFEVQEINKEHIMFCFQAWITVNYDPNVLNSLPNHVLFRKVIEHIEDEECGEGASNCLRSIIYQLKNPEENKSIYEALSACTLQILQLVDHNVKNLELDKAEQFMRIIADFSRKSTAIFIEKYDRNIGAFLKKLIHHMEDDLLNTYQNLADVFQQLLDEMKKIKAEGKIAINQEIYSIFQPLYNALCYKCQLPIRIIKELNQTEESKAHHISSMAEQLLKNRQFTQSIFETLSELQGKTNFLHFVFAKMQTLNPQDEKLFWPNLEIYLYSLIDAVREYPVMDSPAISILQMYIELADKGEGIPICVRRTFLRVFRSLITSQQKNAEYIYRVMCTAVSCFEEPLLYSVAQKTFCKACEYNINIAVNIFSEFGPVLQKYPQRDYIVKGLITVMCSNSDLTKQYLYQALTFLFGKFKQEIDKSKRKQYMHSIVAALKAFKESPVAKQNIDILKQFMRDIWPFTKQLLSSPQRLKDDEDSDVERIVRILKVVMRTLEFQFSEFLEDLFTTVLTAFQKHPICSYVYLVEVAVTVFSSNSAYTDYLRRLYSDFCQIAYEHMKKIEDISRYSYFLDDFMGMNKRFFLYNASVVLSSGKLPNIIEICINAFMGCDTPRVAKAAYSFFETVFMVYWRPEYIHLRNTQEDVTPFVPKPEDSSHYLALKAFLLQKIEQIVAKMLEHLSTAPTEQTRDYILDALVSQIKGFTEQNPTVWQHFLSKISSQILVQKQKERMVQMLESLKGCDFQTSKKTVKALDKMLVLLNRRIINADKRKNLVF